MALIPPDSCAAPDVAACRCVPRCSRPRRLSIQILLIPIQILPFYCFASHSSILVWFPCGFRLGRMGLGPPSVHSEPSSPSICVCGFADLRMCGCAHSRRSVFARPPWPFRSFDVHSSSSSHSSFVPSPPVPFMHVFIRSIIHIFLRSSSPRKRACVLKSPTPSFSSSARLVLQSLRHALPGLPRIPPHQPSTEH